MLNTDDESSLPKSKGRVNTDDESSLDQPPKSKGRGKGQSGIQGATKGTRTLSGETNLAVTTCTCNVKRR